MAEGLADLRRPQARDDRQLFFQAGELLLRERYAVRLVLLLEPARAQAQFDSAGHLVDPCDLDRKDAGQPEGGGRHQCAQPDALGFAGESGEGDPGVGGTGEAVHGAHAEVVVGAKEGVEAEVLGGLGHGEQGVVAGPLLGLGEDSKIHAAILHGRIPVNARVPPVPPRPRPDEIRQLRAVGGLVA